MNEEEKQKLWDEYSKKHTPELREQIIMEYANLVKIVAGRLSIYLGYNVEYEDLVSYGIFGLIDAIDKFDCEKGVKFETYASLRIRGAILDQIRKMDWLPRTLRQRQKKIDAAYQKLETISGRSATDKELAQELEISTDELENWQNQMKISNLVSLDEYMEQGEGKVEAQSSEDYAQPERVIEKEELKSPSSTLTAKKWIEATNAIGLQSKQGKNGGTYAHPEIACAFCAWLRPEFQYSLVQSFFAEHRNWRSAE